MSVHEKPKIHAHAIDVLQGHLFFMFGNRMAASFMSRSPIAVNIAKRSGLIFDAIQSREFSTDMTIGEWVGDLFDEFMYSAEAVA
jgi:hypothetical protein